MNEKPKQALENVCAAYDCTMEEATQILAQQYNKLELEKRYEADCYEDMVLLYVDEYNEYTLERRRELAEFGRSRLAQFGKTRTMRQFVKARPFWFRTRSFCVRSPYG